MPRASTEIARKLRRRTTPAEARLWPHLRDRRFADLKFRRQMPIGRYVVDFCCPQRKVVIELDGDSHGDREDYDLERTADLQRRGFRVLRFWNQDVFENIEGVLETILELVGIPSP